MKKITQISVLVLTLSAYVLLLASCNPAKPDTGKREKPEIGKEQLVAVAEQEMIRRGWKRIEVESVSWNEDGHWELELWRLPKVPGGHATVAVSKEGEVVRVIPGI